MKDILRFVDFKNWLKLLKKIMRTRTQLQFYMTVQSERYYRSFKVQSLIIRVRQEIGNHYLK